MPLDAFDSPRLWNDDLDARWPERIAMRREVVRCVSAGVASATHTPRLLELGFGVGDLLEKLITNLPTAQFVGIEGQTLLAESVLARLKATPNLSLLVEDLNGDTWLTDANGPFDVVYSLQTFHDLGRRDALVQIYERIYGLLSPNGCVVNADFMAPHAHDDPSAPRRFGPDVHCEILSEIGFHDPRCSLRIGQLGCIVALREAPPS